MVENKELIIKKNKVREGWKIIKERKEKGGKRKKK